MTDENTNYTTAVPAVTFSKTGLLVPDEVDILNGRLTDFSTALGSSMGTSLTSPQGQLAMSDSAIIADKNDQLLAIANQVNADYSSGRFQDAIGRVYFLDRIGATGTTVTGTCSGLVDTLILLEAWHRMKQGISTPAFPMQRSAPPVALMWFSRTSRQARSVAPLVRSARSTKRSLAGQV